MNICKDEFQKVLRCVGTIFSGDNLAEKKPIKLAKSKSRSG